jgi:hypothetical protein
VDEFKWTQATRRIFGEIVAQCWVDAKFKRQFVSRPKKVLLDFGLDLPSDVTPKVLDIQGVTWVKAAVATERKAPTTRTLWILLPPRPSELDHTKAKGKGTRRAKRDDVTRASGTVVLGPVDTIILTPTKPKKPPK